MIRKDFQRLASSHLSRFSVRDEVCGRKRAFRVLASATLFSSNSLEPKLGLKFKHKIMGKHELPPESVYIKRFSHTLDGEIPLRLTYNAYDDFNVVCAIG